MPHAEDDEKTVSEQSSAMNFSFSRAFGRVMMYDYLMLVYINNVGFLFTVKFYHFIRFSLV